MVQQITRNPNLTAGDDSFEWHMDETETLFAHLQKWACEQRKEIV